MGFHIEINSILRSDEPYELAKGRTCDFQKTGSRVFFDTLPIWLTKSDWTALAEIQILSQTRTPGDVRGTFRVTHVYEAAEQAVVTEMFRRLYAAGDDPNIYVLISEHDYAEAKNSGSYAPESLSKEGFVHAAPFNQVNRVANKYYKTVLNPQIMVVALSRILPLVKWEPATGGLYPHIFGALNMDAVISVFPIRMNASGVFEVTRADIGG